MSGPEPERLSKRMSALGFAARHEADETIKRQQVEAVFVVADEQAGRPDMLVQAGGLDHEPPPAIVP